MRTAIDLYEDGLRLYRLRAIGADELLNLANAARLTVGLGKIGAQEFLERVMRKA